MKRLKNASIELNELEQEQYELLLKYFNKHESNPTQEQLDKLKHCAKDMVRLIDDGLILKS